MNYLEMAKQITRAAFPTYTQAQQMNDGRQTCLACQAPCGLTREWRGAGLCDACYSELDPPMTRPKHLLPRKE